MALLFHGLLVRVRVLRSVVTALLASSTRKMFLSSPEMYAKVADASTAKLSTLPLSLGGATVVTSTVGAPDTSTSRRFANATTQRFANILL